jgi:hypothetical protein
MRILKTCGLVLSYKTRSEINFEKKLETFLSLDYFPPIKNTFTRVQPCFPVQTISIEDNNVSYKMWRSLAFGSRID